MSELFNNILCILGGVLMGFMIIATIFHQYIF